MAERGLAPIWILLATFNGERFLPALLASLSAQTDDNWKLLVSDDASTDGTMAQLRSFAATDARMEILAAADGPLGACANFARLLQAALAAGAAFFALCDQDDVWHADKLARMRSELADGDPTMPMLVYADLNLVDVGGNGLGESHFSRAGTPQVRAGVDTWLFAHNLVPGCAMAGNRALLELALPVPVAIHHHDWWLLLVAAATGKVRAVDDELTDYRQHGGNLIGAASPLRRALAFVPHFSARVAAARAQYWLAVDQADVLLTRAQERQASLYEKWRRAAKAACDRLGDSRRGVRLRAALFGPVQRLGVGRKLLMAAAAVPRRPYESVARER